MIKMIGSMGDRMLSLVAPRAVAAAACTIDDAWFACGYCRTDPYCGSTWANAVYHAERLNDCRWYTDVPCSAGYVGPCC